MTALRHKTSDTRRLCSLSRVMSADQSRLFLPCGAVALRFQRYGVFWLIPSNIPGHKRRTSPRHRGMPHCRSALQYQDMSRDQSEPLLTKRCMEGQWKKTCETLFEREKASVRRDGQFNSLPGRCGPRAGSKTIVPDSDIVFRSNVVTSASQ